MSSQELKRQIQKLQAENKQLRKQLEQKNKVATRALASYQQRALHMEMIRQQNEELNKLAADLTRAKQLSEDHTYESTTASQQLAQAIKTLEKEIAERKQAEAELKTSRDFLDNILNAIDDPVFVKDQQHRWVILNDACCKLIGHPREALLGKTIESFVPKEQADKFFENERQVLDTGQTNVSEEEATWQGKLHAFLTKKSLLKDPISDHKYIVGVIRDITERKQTEVELQQHATQLALINNIGSQITVMQELDTLLNQATQLLQENFDYHHVALFLIDNQVLKLKAVAGAYQAYFPAGHTQNMNQGINGWVATHGEKVIANDVSAEPHYISLIADHTVTRSELTLPIKVDGQTIGVLDIQSPQLNTFGQSDIVALEALTGQIAVAIKNAYLYERAQQELSERKRAEQQYRNLFEEAPVMYVISQNRNGQPWIIDCNELFLSTLGYSRAEVIEQPMTKFLTAESRRKMLEGGGYQRALAGQFTIDERQLLTRNGRIIETLIQTSVETDANGQVTGTRAMFSEITQLKQTEAALQQAKEAAETASRAKSEFLANMSHEIRTPMNGIIGMTELMLDTELTSTQREYAEMVKASADSLLTIINDILDFSKIEAGKLDLSLTNFDLRESLGATMQTLALRAHEKGLELAYHIPAEVPGGLVGDPGRLRQIIVNLVGNAIKFTEQGEVVLYVDVELETETDVGLHFTIADTGIGIPPEKQQLIFDAFNQVDGSTTRQFEGTGLGLTISSQLVAMMGGQIWVESQVGRGSQFHFTARFGRYSQNLIPKPVKLPVLKDLSVLVVDDNATNRRILVDMLTNWRMKPTAVDRGDTALVELRRAVAEGQPYSLILLDAMMPGMDGFTLAEKIKHDPKLIEATIMMISSIDHPNDVARCHQLGISLYLTKPVTQSGLLNAIVMTLNGGKLEVNESTSMTDTVFENNQSQLHILLAEDNMINQRLASTILKKRGHTVVVVSNGQDVLAAIKKETFDLILMDVQMPIMDGFEVTAAIRAIEQHTNTHTPIIAMTAHAMNGDRERCLTAGMDGYIAKPIQPKTVIKAIEGVMPAVPLAAPAPSVEAEESVLDWDYALAQVEGDTTILQEIVTMLLNDELPQLMLSIQNALKQRNGQALQNAAHTLKGVVKNFGAKRIAGIAQQLEIMGQNEDFAKAEAAYAKLRQENRRLIQKLTMQSELTL